MKRMSARLIASIVTALLLAALSIILVSAWLVVQGRQLNLEMESKVRVSTQLAVEACIRLLAEGEVLRLRQLADRYAGDEQVVRVMIADRTGQVIADSRREALGTQPPLIMRSFGSRRVLIEKTPEYWTGAYVVYDEIIDRDLGVVAIDFSTVRLEEAQASARMAGLMITLLGIGIGILIALVGVGFLTRPLTMLVQAIHCVEAGEMESPVEATGSTELVEIGNAFNAMVTSVRQRIRNLEILNQMESGLARSADLATSVEVMKRASQSLLNADLYLWIQEPVSRMLMQIGSPGEAPISEPVPPESDFPVARGFTGRPMIMIGEDSDLPPGTEIAGGMTVNSGVVLPLWTPEGMAGVLAVVNPHGRRFVTKEDSALSWAIAALAAPMVAAAVRTQMQGRAVAALQALLIPELPTDTGADVSALYLPAEEAAGVGGDYYDFAEIGESRWGIVVGDSSGKGLEAARYTTMAKWILRSFMHEYENPADVLRQSNRVLAMQEMAEGFITVFCCTWDSAQSLITYAVAGHPAPLLYSALSGDVREVPSTGSALGVTLDATFTHHEVFLNSGDVLCLYTDGITEARQGDEWFSDTRFAEALKDHAHESSREIAEAIIAQVKEFTGGVTKDDIALVVLKAQ